MCRWTLTLALVMGAVGCARYEYNLLAPPELAGHIGNQVQHLSAPPLAYRMQSYDNRLVLRIDNPTDDPIMLLGAESVVVDPSGESHALRTRTIAPGSFIKLVLPPLPPPIEPRGPRIGVGFGYRMGRADAAGPPRYLQAGSEGEVYWKWQGGTTVRMTLVFDRRGEVFRQSFVFERVKK